MSADRVATLNSQLTIARQKLATLTEQRDAIIRRDEGRHWTETDSAIGSGVRRKPNPRADARRFHGYDRDARVFADQAEAEKSVVVLEARLADAMAERDRVRFTRTDLVGAVAVRSALFGWRRVRRVNQKTVSVDSGYSWADLIPIDDVLDYRVGGTA